MSSTEATERKPGSNRPVPNTLPLQNILLATGILAACVVGVVGLNAWVGFPFGRLQWVRAVERCPACGPHLWLVLVSVVALFSARGVAKLLLLPRKGGAHYGYWLLALSALLATLPLVGFDLLATQVKSWWHWENVAWHWQGIALPNLAGWFLANVIALLLATPALIDKRPVQPPPGLRPLAIWFALNAGCLAGSAARASDAAVAVLAAPVVAVTMLAYQAYRHTVADCNLPPESK
jgi:hypothetical protein